MEEFKKKAIRTESVIDSVRVNKKIFTTLQYSMIRLSDSMDLIKKNVFYQKEINLVRLVGNLQEVTQSTQYLFDALTEDPTMCDDAQMETCLINSREFHATVGMVTEAVELLELLDLSEEYMDTFEVKNEMGDYSWYFGIMADAKDIDIEEDILEGVITKLIARFPEKFEAALAVHKDQDKEKAAVAESKT